MIEIYRMKNAHNDLANGPFMLLLLLHKNENLWITEKTLFWYRLEKDM